jgi:hypothetical protein
MPGELLQIALDPMNMTEVRHFSMEGASHIGGIIAGASGTAIAGIAIYMRMKSNSKQEGIGKDGRVRFIDQGYIGLRERSRQFYKSTPIYDPFELIEDPEGGPVSIHDIWNADAEPVDWDKEFYELLKPGLVVAPHPWRKYKLLNTQNDNRAFSFFERDLQVPDKYGRLYNIGGNFTWGHITGVDEHRQLKHYEYYEDGIDIRTGEKRRAGPVRVEQLVFNGIMAGKGTKETDVGDQVRTVIEPVIFKLLKGRKNPMKHADKIEPIVKETTHDRLLDLGAELRVLEPIVTPNKLGHLAMNDRSPQERQRDLELVGAYIVSQEEQSQIGFSPAARTNIQA